MAQKIDATHESPATADAGGVMHFDGSVDLGGAVTSEMLTTLFGPDATVKGKLRFDGSVRIDGTFEGSIRTNDALIVGENAKITAEIICGSANVSGEVVGNITATDSVSLAISARVKGDITAPSLSVEKGATFDGLSRMGTTKTKRR